MNRQIKILTEILDKTHIPRWEELPEIDLYIDQTVSYITSKISMLFESNEKIITPAMINNYVKLKLIPEPIKKKYNRVHLAYLITITILKQVLPISKIKTAIIYQTKISSKVEAYNLFCEHQELACKSLILDITNKKTNSELDVGEITVKMATKAFATNLMACKSILIEEES